MCFGTKFAKFQSFETWSRTSSPFLTRASELQSHKRGYELIEWEENGSTLELEEEEEGGAVLDSTLSLNLRGRPGRQFLMQD